MNAAQHIIRLASEGRYTFTTTRAQEALGTSEVAAQAALRRLRQRGGIATPARGFHVIVPPEYRRLGCLPASEFVPELMSYLQAPYYSGLLTAAEIHGAAHHKPQVFQVVTDRNRRPLGAGRVRIAFIAKVNVEATPTLEKATDRGYLRVSTPEATAFDLVTYVGHAGGLDNVATVLAELADRLDRDKLAALARSAATSSTQRLGWLLELVEHHRLAQPLASYISEERPPAAPLRAGRSIPRLTRSRLDESAEGQARDQHARAPVGIRFDSSDADGRLALVCKEAQR